MAYAPVTSSGVPTLVGRSYTVREAGYAYLYISNEQVMQTDVYFDDVKFTYTPMNVLQYTEFYSHGAPNAQSWTRENTTANNFLGNGGTELNPTTSLYDLHYRNYDPVLGRMNQIDPVADKYGSVTPYNYAFNSPVNLNDPMGDEPPRLPCAVCGGFGENVSSVSYRRERRNGFDEWNNPSLSAGGFGTAISYFRAQSLNDQSGSDPFWNSVRSFFRSAPDGETNIYSGNGKGQYGFWVSSDTQIGLVGSAGIFGIRDRFIPISWVDTQGGSTSSDFIYDNNNSIVLGLEIIENGTTEAIEEVLKNKAVYTTGAKIGTKVVGGSVIGLNLGVTFYTIGKELQSNDPKAFNTHSFVNMGVTVLTTGATPIAIIFAGATAPVWVPAVAIGGAAIGIGYGIAQVAGIDEWIDSRYGFK